MNKQQLAAKIWASANNMRSKIEANEYKDYILGFIFYKFLSEREEKMLLNEDWTKEDFNELIDDGYDPETTKQDVTTYNSLSDEVKEHIEVIIHCQEKLGYFIPYKHLFSTWLGKGHDFSADDVRIALSSFDRFLCKTHKKVFDKIFNTLQTGLSKLGDTTSSQTNAISQLIDLIKDIPTDDKQDYDVLGFIYEYLISQFASEAGKKAGEFYTPHEVSILMSEIVANHLKNREKIEIYDPTSGSGSLLINIGKSVAKYMKDKNKIKYYAQELKDNTYNLTRMNLVMRGILPDNIVARNGDTLEDDWPYFDDNDKERTYQTLRVDAVVSNPPYSQKWDPTNKENDPRYSRFGLAPKSKADYAFLLHDLYHLKPDGIMTIVLPHGVLFRGGEEGKIRQNLIESNHIDAIISLPANIFFGTGIPTIIMVIRQKRQNDNVLIIDASKGFIKDGKKNRLQSSDIKRIVDIVIERKTVEGYSRVVELEEIRNNDYNLNIPRYVDSSEKAESWDICSIMQGGISLKEIDEFKQYWDAFPSLKQELFKEVSPNSSYFVFNDVASIKEKVINNKDVVDFINDYQKSFSDLPDYLNNLLIDNISNVNVASSETMIADNLFKRIKNIPLIDKYKAYQLLDDKWIQIANDIEIIQTEGFDCTKLVDPYMVVKKKGDKEIEIQEGWEGYVVPFDIIWETKLVNEKHEIDDKNSRLSEITSLHSEIIENFNEEDKESNKELFNDEMNAFVKSQVTKAAKQIAKQSNIVVDSFESQIIYASKLIEEEKQLKKEIKELTSKLELKTKSVIENLSNDDVKELLNKKWIEPLIDNLNKLPSLLLNELVNKLNKLSKKYETPLFNLENEIEQTEAELASMIDELDACDADKKGLLDLKKMLEGK